MPAQRPTPPTLDDVQRTIRHPERTARRGRPPGYRITLPPTGGRRRGNLPTLDAYDRSMT